MLLLDLDDLRALLSFVADNRKEISTQYGLVNSQSIAAIQRALLTLEREGGEALFAEPAHWNSTTSCALISAEGHH